MWKPSGNLIIANQTFKIDAPVINWLEGPRWDATSQLCKATLTDPSPPCTYSNGANVPYGKLPLGPYTQRYATRPALRQYGGGFNAPLDAVKAVIKKFVIHHDGCSTADMCFSVLQNERGLSVQFLIDNDGTIFQTIDLALMAYHASEWNVDSIGVEMCNRGEAFKEPHYYDSGRFGPKRDIVDCKINNSVIRAFAYTPQQMDSLTRLSRALVRLLPNLPQDYPQKSPGQQHWGTLPYGDTFRFAGYIGHYHLWNQKWDPGPFDFKAFCAKLRGIFSFPLHSRDNESFTSKQNKKKQQQQAQTSPDDPPVVPQDSDELQDATKALYALNEKYADGGFFPVGPWGEYRLWHGGIHVIGKENGAVFAPFPGRLVAARMGANSPIGSVNFVLLRHDMNLGTSRAQFYSLYMHLADELASDDKSKPEWMTKEGSGWKDKATPNEVALLDEPIEAGAIIGHIGRVGPGDLARTQMHLEFFSTAEMFTGMVGSPWNVIDGTASGRFCDAPEVNSVIDTNHDGMISKQELKAFYETGGGQALYFYVPLFVSEWCPEPSWRESLGVTKDFKKLKPAELDELVADQIQPTLWWTPEVAVHAHLPVDGVVYHYHPISFLGWFNQQLIDAQIAAGPGNDIDPSLASAVPKGITDDLADVTGESMRTNATQNVDPCNGKLTLQDIVEGFEAPECEGSTP